MPERIRSAAMSSLPHRFPFQFVTAESVESSGTELLLRLSHGTGPLRGLVDLPPTLGIEIIAQAAAVAFAPGDGEGEPPEAVFLAGCDAELSETVYRRPMTAGDALRIHVRKAGALGPMQKVSGEIERDGETLMRVDLLLTRP